MSAFVFLALCAGNFATVVNGNAVKVVLTVIVVDAVKVVVAVVNATVVNVVATAVTSEAVL